MSNSLLIGPSIESKCSVLLGIEGSVSTSDWGLENGHFLGLVGDWGFLDLSEGGGILLIVVEWLSLHDDVLTEVLITVHTGGEELGVWWGAGNASDTGVNASRDLDETTGRWHSLGPGWLVEVCWAIGESVGGDRGGEEGEISSFHYFNYYNYSTSIYSF